MASVTLTTLRTRVRERADMVGSSFVADSATSLDALINAALDETYDLIIEPEDSDYFVSSSALSTVAGTTDYALPSDFYRLKGIDLNVGTDPVELVEFSWKERNAVRASTWLTTFPGAPRYRIRGSTLWLYPPPASVMTGTIWYVPVRTQLSAGSDAVNFPNGWEEHAVIGATIKLKDKEESDVSVLMAEKQGLEERIRKASKARVLADPGRAIDIESGYIGGDSLWWR